MKYLTIAQNQLLIGLFLCLSFYSNAQNDISIANGFGLGGQLTQHQQDFGLGLQLTSPFFVGNSLALRLRGNLMWNQHVQDQETTWSPYSNVSLGLVGAGQQIGNSIRLYGEGGIVLLFPSGEFSDESLVLGGYGVFGFEFFMAKFINYYIELGGIGTGATANLVPNKPIYSNGFLINVGFRYVL